MIELRLFTNAGLNKEERFDGRVGQFVLYSMGHH